VLVYGILSALNVGGLYSTEKSVRINMVSQNRLLGSGIPEGEPIAEHIEPTYLRAPAWRFHKDFPDKLCKTDAELDKLDAEGWLDHPGKVRLLPGHEKVWEAYQKSLETGKTDEVKEEILIDSVKSEDQIRADALKAESDKVEAKRLEDIRKAEEKRLKDERREEEKRLEDEKKAEAKRLAEYEAAKNPPGPRICTLCGKTFDSIRALNMHGIGAHRNKK